MTDNTGNIAKGTCQECGRPIFKRRDRYGLIKFYCRPMALSDLALRNRIDWRDKVRLQQKLAIRYPEHADLFRFRAQEQSRTRRPGR